MEPIISKQLNRALLTNNKNQKNALRYSRYQIHMASRSAGHEYSGGQSHHSGKTAHANARASTAGAQGIAGR
ncbi:hypothetical protein ABXT34_24555 [Ralstonia sp. SM1884_UCD616_TZ26]|uniref:hypothetical protein n=1 Tax=Ralstonia pseudosolanacearum TaxID=1310165 RepID=UPI00339B21A6